MKQRLYIILIHFFMWAALFGSVYVKAWIQCEECNISHIASHFFLFAGAVYFNLYVLVDRYLINKKYLKYFLFALGFQPLLLGLSYLYTMYKPGETPNPESISKYFFMILFIQVLFIFFHLGTRFFKEKQKNEFLERERVKSELALLRAQLNPHFLFNTLNSMYALSLNKSDKLPGLILELSDYLDFVISGVDKKYIELEKEIALIENYLAIEKTRLGEKVKVDFDKTEIKNLNFPVLPLILSTFIENAFKHGAYQLRKNGYVKIRIASGEDFLEFNCENNYLENKENTTSGTGLSNIEKQLKLFYDFHELKIDQKDQRHPHHQQGVSVRLRIV